MSAYICTAETFAAIATFAELQRITHPVTREQVSPVDVASILYAENVASVNYRYDESTDATLPSPAFYRFTQIPALHILSCLNCLEYQSCEHPEWNESVAAQLLNQIRRAAIRALPGYEHAPWGLPAKPCTALQEGGAR
jgi:hypothetical protein